MEGSNQKLPFSHVTTLEAFGTIEFEENAYTGMRKEQALITRRNHMHKSFRFEQGDNGDNIISLLTHRQLICQHSWPIFYASECKACCSTVEKFVYNKSPRCRRS